MRKIAVFMAPLAFLMTFSSCEQRQADLIVEKVPVPTPNLPAVPTLPPPKHPIQYEDGSYSVEGLRRRTRDTIDGDVSVTGYIVWMSEGPEEGAEDRTEVTPYVMIADEPDETVRKKMLMVTGYAQYHSEVEEAKKGKNDEPNAASGVVVPADFAVGNKVLVSGQFKYDSRLGHKNGRGLMDYQKHETIEFADDE